MQMLRCAYMTKSVFSNLLKAGSDRDTVCGMGFYAVLNVQAHGVNIIQ